MSAVVEQSAVQSATLVAVATTLSRTAIGSGVVSTPAPVGAPVYPTPLGYLDTQPESLLGTLLTPINPASISFEAVKQDLVNWALNKPDGVAWKDWFATDDGTIIAEWIAGLATFRKIAETMRIREASLDFAQLESSIYEIAFNRGLLVAPAAAPIVQLSLKPAAGAAIQVSIGDFVGLQGNYELYSLESKTLQPNDLLNVAVGHLNTFSPAFSTLGRFAMFKVPLKDRYVARELESFLAAGTPIPLVSEPNNIGGFSNGFVLRRVLPSQVRMYVGNGTMGWYDPSVKDIAYSCLSYGADVAQSLGYTPKCILNAKITAWTEVQPPSFDPDKETLRAVTRYYPLDGRIVTDHDYEAVIRKYFGGVLHDVVAYNTDPNEQVLLLPNASYGLGTPQEGQQLAGIRAIVDERRGLGMNVLYTVLPPSAGKTVNFTFAVAAASLTADLQARINDIAASQVNRFARIPVTFGALDFATQISAKFGIRFRPLDPSAAVSLGPTDFLASFTIGLVSG